MRSLAWAALRRPVLVLGLFLLGTAWAAAGLFRLELRTDGAAIYPQGNATVEQTLADRAAFREPEQIILVVSSRSGGPLVASPEGFRFLRQTYRELPRLPGVRSLGVRSLADLVEPPPPGTFSILTFLDDIPDDPRAFAGLLARIHDLPVANGLFLSRDGRLAPVYVFLADSADRRDVIAQVESWRASRAGNVPFDLRITGPVAAEAVLGETVLADLARLVPVMVAVIALLLWISLRTPGGVLVPLAQVVATLIWTFGLMGWAGVPVTLVTTILPVLLMAMAMTDEIHLLERVQDLLAADTGGGSPRERVCRVTKQAFGDLASPLALTSYTNAAGFFSFSGGPMLPLRDFGIFAGIGLLIAMLSTFSMVPALLALLPPGWIERRQSRGTEPRGVPPLERLLARRARVFALGGAFLVAAAVPGLFRLSVQDSWIDNFDRRSPLVTAERAFNASLWGTYRFDVVFEKDRLFFWTPEGMALLEDFDRLVDQAPHVGGALGPLRFFRIGAGILDYRRPLSSLSSLEARRVGGTVEVLALRVDLRQYLTQDAEAARTRLFVRDADYAKGKELRAWLEARLPALAARHGVRAHVSGDVPVGLAVVGAIVGNQLRSIGWTTLLLAVTLLAAFRSLRWSAIAMAPVLAATLLLFGVLGSAGIPLGIATSMFAALSLGAGVDFALHFIHAYRRESGSGRSHEETVLATLRTAGRGLLWNALVLAFGFSVLAFSAIKPNASLGFLLAAAMLASYAATVVFLPEMVRRFGGDGRRRTAPASWEG